MYPGLSDHPQSDRALRLPRRGGCMVGADLGAPEAAWAFIDALRLVRVASSFGGVGSESTHSATTSHRRFSPADRAAAGITDGRVRISAGLEDAADLAAGVSRALEEA